MCESSFWQLFSNKNCFGLKMENIKEKNKKTNSCFPLPFFFAAVAIHCSDSCFFSKFCYLFRTNNNKNPRSSCFHLYCAPHNWPCQLGTFWKRACDQAHHSIWYLSAESEKNLFCYWTAGKWLLRNQSALSTRSLFRASGQLTCRAFLF